MAAPSDRQRQTFALERCRLRPWRDGDQDALVRHADNPKVARQLLDRFPHPYTREDADSWIALCQSGPAGTRFAIEVGGEAAGGVGLKLGDGNFCKTAEIGYWLGEAHWGRGIATEAVRAVTPWAFEAHDLARIQAGVFEANPASARVLEKAGYQFEGRLRQSVFKDGQLLDRLMYARLAEKPDPRTSPGSRHPAMP